MNVRNIAPRWRWRDGYVLILLANSGIGQRDNVRFDLQELVRRRIAAGESPA